MIDQQEKHLMGDIKKNLQQQGFTDEMADEYFQKWHDDLHTKASFQVKSGLILDTLAKEYSIEAGDEDLEDKIKETAESANMDAKQVREYYTSNEQMKKNMLYAIREEKTFAKLKEIVKVS